VSRAALWQILLLEKCGVMNFGNSKKQRIEHKEASVSSNRGHRESRKIPQISPEQQEMELHLQFLWNVNIFEILGLQTNPFTSSFL